MAVCNQSGWYLFRMNYFVCFAVVIFAFEWVEDQVVYSGVDELFVDDDQFFFLSKAGAS